MRVGGVDGLSVGINEGNIVGLVGVKDVGLREGLSEGGVEGSEEGA